MQGQINLDADNTINVGPRNAIGAPRVLVEKSSKRIELHEVVAMQINCDKNFSLAKTIFVDYSFHSSFRIFLRFLETIESNEALLPHDTILHHMID